MNKIIIKSETNGLYNVDSVLSFSFLKIDEFNRVIEYGSRYYFPTEDYNSDAIAINGLNAKKLKWIRGKAKYPEHFEGDTEWIEALFSNVDTVISYNLDFEYTFLPKNIKDMDLKIFSIMEENVDIVGVTHTDSNNFKFPTFKETASFYGVSINPKKTNGTYMCGKIYELYCKTIESTESQAA